MTDRRKRPESEGIAILRSFLEGDSPRPGAVNVKRPAGPPEPKVEIGYVLHLPSPSAGGGLEVEVLQRVTPVGGPPGKWEPVQVTEARVGRCADPADRAILAALREAMERTASLAFAKKDDARGPSIFALSRAARDRIVPMLCRTGRCRPQVRMGARWSAPVAWNEEPWRLRLRVTEAEADPGGGAAWDVGGVLTSGGEVIPVGAIEALFDGGLALVRGRFGRIDDGGASSWLSLLQQHPRVRIGASRRAAFLEELYSLPSEPPLDLPGGVAIPEVAVAPLPRLYLHPPGDAREGSQSPMLFAELSFAYDGAVVAARKPGAVAFDAERVRIVRRDAAAETAARARLDALGFEPIPKTPAAAPPGEAHAQIAAARVPSAVIALVSEGWRVEGSGKVYRKPSGFRATLRSGVDWFDLAGNFDFDGYLVPLPAALEAVRRGDGAVVLGDGSLGMLPDAWLSRHGLLARLGTVNEEGVRFRKSQLSLLDALLGGLPEVHADEEFTRAKGELEGAAITPSDPPEGFRGTLRGYQREGLGWLQFLARTGLGGCLADDMGLGKTVQVLALLASQRGAGRPSLIVAPRSLIFNWTQEAARFTPDLRLVDHTGSSRAAPGTRFQGFDLVLTTYGTLRRDAEMLAEVDFKHVILDEAQAIKNDASETSRAARLLRADHRLALTGTPVENHLGELWSIFEFLNPGMLGRASVFRAATRERASPEAISGLARALRPFLLRRTKAQVAADLPERLEETRMCELEPAQRALYDELREHYRSELRHRIEQGGLKRSKVHVLEALLRLRQAACHPGLVDPKRRGDRSAKLEALFADLPELREKGQKALVFSQFTSLLSIVREELDAQGVDYAYLDGNTRDRKAPVDRFQNDPSCSLFLISLKAGGVGLNLTAAEYVFLLDPWWNPAAEAQAIDRAHRIGQRRAVFAYRLIAKDTIEERIAEMQRAKKTLAERVIEGDGSLLADLSAEDLELLLS